jgi:hypothetical protein
MEIIQQNFLNPTGFRFDISRLPHVNFFVQSVTLPGITLGSVMQAAPFRPIHRHGDKVEYDDISITFRVDEEMMAYQEIMNWMTSLVFEKPYEKLLEGDGLYSDASLVILSSGKNPNIIVTMEDVFPTNLSSIDVNSSDSDVTTPTCTVSFKVNNFKIKNIS